MSEKIEIQVDELLKIIGDLYVKLNFAQAEIQKLRQAQKTTNVMEPKKEPPKE